jgi:hypothetical protein
MAARSRIKPKSSTPANQTKGKPPNIHCLPSSLIMGRGFEVHNSHQQPTVRALHYHALAGQPSAAFAQPFRNPSQTTAGVHDCIDRSLRRFYCTLSNSVHRRGDQLVFEHAPDFRYILSRSDEQRSHHMPPGLKPAMWQPDFPD